jgi:hypothetical protein
MLEYDHIKELAIKFFNSQFERNLIAHKFDLICIPKKINYPIAFEIFTEDKSDFLRLRVYLSLGKEDNLQEYKLEVNSPYTEGSNTDEVWVALGTLDTYNLESGYMKENNLLNCTDEELGVILDENGQPLLAEFFGFLLIEN